MSSRFRLKEGWISFFLVLALALTPAAALNSADYLTGLEIMSVVVGVSVVAGLLISKSRFRPFFAHFLSLVYGAALLTFLIGRQFPADLDWKSRILDLATRQGEWLLMVFTEGTNRDGLVFIMHTGVIFWIIGYMAAWYTFRSRRLWRAIIPAGILLLFIVYYYYGPRPLLVYLVVYVLIALLYITNSFLLDRREEWEASAVRYESGIQYNMLRASFIFAAVAVAFSWSLPAFSASAVLNEAMGGAGVTSSWRKVQDNWSRMFASLRSYGSGTNDPYSDTLTLGGPRSVGQTLVMDVQVDEQLPYAYWQAAVYDTYENGSWTASRSSRELRYPDEGPFDLPVVAGRSYVKQRVINYSPNAGGIYGAPEITEVDRQIYVSKRVDDFGNDVISGLESRFVMGIGDSYELISRIATVDADTLRRTNQVYPNTIRDVYLQVPDSITPQTLELAAELVSGHDNVFDKAIAVRDYLRANIAYNDQISAPPQESEPIHYILFEGKEAYCNYYASSMAIMLRSQGIPARVVGGFSQGIFNQEFNFYRVKASNAHSWVEVYFPAFGWIQFEPTASIPVVDRSVPITNPGDAFSDDEGASDSPEGGPGSDEEPLSDAERLGDLLGEEEDLGALRFGSGSGTLPVAAIIGVALVAAAGLLMLRYKRQVESDVARSYGSLGWWSKPLGVAVHESDTPYERMDRLAEAAPEAREPLRTIVQGFVVSRFSREKSAPVDLPEAWSKLRPALIRSALEMRLVRLQDWLRRSEDDSAKDSAGQ